MASEDFYCQYEGKTLDEAFQAAVNDAYYWHGHNGYTGTICEKDSAIAYLNIPTPSADEAFEFYEELMQTWQKDSELLNNKFGKEVAAEMAENFNNKYGPAVAFHLDNGDWFFCGYASA